MWGKQFLKDTQFLRDTRYPLDSLGQGGRHMRPDLQP